MCELASYPGLPMFFYEAICGYTCQVNTNKCIPILQVSVFAVGEGGDEPASGLTQMRSEQSICVHHVIIIALLHTPLPLVDALFY